MYLAGTCCEPMKLLLALGTAADGLKPAAPNAAAAAYWLAAP